MLASTASGSAFDYPSAKQVDLPPGGTAHRLRFVGDGRTYFRFWMVNVLLAVVTLGLYKPLARRRTVQYFYEHTLVAGSPLTFTATKRSMMTGFVLAVLLGMLWKVGRYSGLDALMALTIVGMTLWTPLVWRSGLRFRLANTRWRGLRLQFVASWQDLYRAYWPSFVTTAVILAVMASWWALAPVQVKSMFDVGGWLDALLDQDDFEPTDAMWHVLYPGLAVVFLAMMRQDYNLTHLRVTHSWLGAQRFDWQRPAFSAFVKIWLMTLVWLGVVVLVCMLGDAVFEHFVSDMEGIKDLKHKSASFVVWLVLGLVAFVGLLVWATSPARAYYQARMFQLLWNRITLPFDDGDGDSDGNGHARFVCTLNTRDWMWLRLKNAVLRTLSLGFYAPLARMAEYRMKLESVTVYVNGDVEKLVGVMQQKQSGALGDALMDAAGWELAG